MRLPVLFRDEQLVAVHKPSGLLVHRTGLDPAAQRFAVQVLRAQLGRRVYPVHRLDRGASGVLLFALDRETAAVLARTIREQRMQRTYVAVVRGFLPERGTIDHPLERVRDPAELSPRSPLGDTGGRARPARTRFQRLAGVEIPEPVDRYPSSRYSLVRLEPGTGRRHQLRRHLHHLSHPIIGDSTYGNGRHNRLFARLFGSQRLLLACVALQFEHPLTRAAVELTAALDGDFAPVLERFGWREALPAAWRPS